MTKSVEQIEKDLVVLLSDHPEGLDLIRITEELNVDIRDVKPILIKLQNVNRVSSGLKKIENKSVFNRHYFFL